MKPNSYSLFRTAAIRKSVIGLIGIFSFASATAQTTIYSTDFGTVANVNPAGWTFTGIDMTISTNTPSTGYAGVSGGAYLGEGNSVAFVNTSGTSFAGSQTGISTATLLVNTTGYSSITVGFGMRKSSAGYNTNATYAFEWSTDNVTFTPIAYTESTTGNWGLASGTGLTLPAGASNQATLYLRWTFNRTGTASNFKIDDFSVKGTSSPGVMRITEYMYNANGSGSAGEYVEFTNVGGAPVDMTGWSFDDNSNAPGSQSLTAFGTVQPGESVIFTDVAASTFRSNWNLCTGIRIIGNNSNNLGREDEINLYNASNTLADRLTYGDQTYAPGTIRTTAVSGWTNAAGLGTNTIANWTLSTVGDAEGSYASSLNEIGSPGKSTRATVAYDPCISGGGSSLSITMDVAATTNYLDGGRSTSPSSPFIISGVLNDPTDPAKTLGIDFTIPSTGTLTVTAASNRTSVVPNTNIDISGSGASRNVKITPAAVGYADITITVSDGTNSASYVLSYAASAASVTPANTFWHTGISDGSDAYAIDDNYYISGDDELDVLNVYSRSASGLPVAAFDYTSLLSLPDLSKPEVDLEAATPSAATPNKVYWLGSMSNGKGPAFDAKPNRNRIFATTISGTGPATTFTFAGYYGNLRARLIAWGDANGYNFTASAAVGADSKTVSGFAAEGMVFGPDNTTLYIAFRAPLVPTTTRTKAVIAPIVNFETWFNNGSPAGNPTFAAPIELDLGGRGFRDLIRLSNGTYIIVAGNPAGSPLTSAIYKWTGNAADAPVQVATSADAILNLEGVMQVNSGGPLSSASLQLISDGGDEDLYGDGSAAKDFGDLSLRKFRSDKINAIDLCMTRTGDTTATACGSFTWHGTTYTSTSAPTRHFTTASGCDSIVTLHLTINSAPAETVSITGSASFCPGGSAELSVPAGNTYQWMLNGSPIGGATSNTYTATATGNYTAVITTGSGCTSTSTAQTIILNPLPAALVNTGGATTFCEGDSVILSTTAGNTYQWQLDGSPVLGATSNTFIAYNSGSYNVMVTDSNGCTNTSTAQVITANPLPATTVSASGATTFCQGDSVTLSAPAGATYQWTLNGSPIADATNAAYTAGAQGTYNVQVSDGICSATSANTNITVNALPAATIIASDVTTFCQGDSVTFSTATAGTYQWLLNGSNIGGAASSTYTANTAGNYSVAVSNAAGCADTSSAETVTVNALPSTPTITQSGATLTSSPAATYQWYLNDTLVAGANAQDYTPTQEGDYTVVVTNAAGCEAASAPVAILLTGIVDNTVSNGIIVYPNPYSDHATIQLTVSENSDVMIEVYSLTGQKVETISNGNYAAGTYTFTFSAKQKGYAAGVYAVKTIINNNMTVTRIIEH